jgi:tRNA(adenine34) deaminase
MFNEFDQQCMKRALDLAKQAEKAGEVPVGAVVAQNNDVLAEGYNQSIMDSDPSAHAEMVALRAAAKVLSNYRLMNTTLYVTLEPCSMCAGAMVHARVNRLVFGATDLKTGAAGSVFNIASSDKLNHQITVQGGLYEEESRLILKNFFSGKR